jgi:hypothetical protein
VNMSSIACCIMSFRSHKTLEATLATYQKQNLFAYFDEVVILFQEISDQDKKIAEKYNLNYISTPKNIGIYGGMKMLAEAVHTDYILMLENDCILIETQEQIKSQLELAQKRLDQRQVDVYRLRHRFEPGEKFDTIRKYKKYHLDQGEKFNLYKYILRILRPNKYKKLIGTALYVHQEPQGYLYSKYINKQPEGDFIVDSEVMNWTNQSVLCKRSWFLEEILTYVQQHPSSRLVAGFQDVEKSLNCSWWQNKHYKIGVGLGLFSHKRLDR